MPGPRTYAGGNPTEGSGIKFHGIFERERQPDDLRTISGVIIVNLRYIYLEVFIMLVKGVTIRFEEEMLAKLKFVANYEGRSVNSHILVLARESIARFEEQQGKIKGDMKPDVNVKPPRKS